MEELDSESIHTISPRSNSQVSSYTTDNGFVIKDDVPNISYIQQGFVNNDSVFFSDNELKMDDSSSSQNKATTQIDSAIDVNTNLLIQQKKTIDEIELSQKKFSLCILVNPAPNNTIWLNR
ncbi:11159_t:CDS:2, partial [Racocetra fulgida]